MLGWPPLATPRTRRSAGSLALVAAVLGALVTPLAGGADSASGLRARANGLARADVAIAREHRSAVLSLFSLDTGLQSARSQLAALRDQGVACRG